MTIDEKITVLQAQKAGKLIEFRSLACGYPGWARHDYPHEFNFSYYDYRVKPSEQREPRWGYVHPSQLCTTAALLNYIKVQEVV